MSRALRLVARAGWIAFWVSASLALGAFAAWVAFFGAGPFGCVVPAALGWMVFDLLRSRERWEWATRDRSVGEAS